MLDFEGMTGGCDHGDEVGVTGSFSPYEPSGLMVNSLRNMTELMRYYSWQWSADRGGRASYFAECLR
jgi:hypothetical protein